MAYKAADDAIRASADRWRLIFESSAVGIAVTDKNGFFTAANRAFQGLVGYTEEELRSLSYLDITYEEDRPAISLLRAELWKGKLEQFTHEKRYRRKDGELIWVKVTASAATSNAAPGRFGMAIVEEITDRKRSEAALSESEEHFRNLADTAPVMIWMSGLDKLCTFVNKPWLDFTGRTLRQELGNGWAEAVHPKDLDRCLADYHASFDARRAFHMEYRLRRADGEYRWILDNGRPVYRGREFVGFIGSCIDITEQKLTEQRLRASEMQLVEAQRLTQVGSWERDLADDRIVWSDEMLRILGISNSTPSNYPAFLSCVHPEDRKKVVKADHEVRSTSTPVDVEYRIIRPSGEMRLLRSIVEAIRNDEGVPVRIVGATQDITNAKLAQQQDFARRKLESLGTLASGIAHDFNNLMGSVLALAELAADEFDAGSSPKQELKAIQDVALRGSEIVRQLMIYAGKEHGAPELVDVSGTVKEILELLKVSVSKYATLDAHLEQHLPLVRMNPAQLQELVMNLVTNASEALANREGVIRVTTSRVTLGPESLGEISQTLPEGDYIQLEVSDTGQGITQETQEKVFDPFFTTKSAGHGLGLAIVHGIVRDLDGAVRLISDPGQGTTFQVFLPCVTTAVETN